MEVDLVRVSCGKAVPYFDYKEGRDQLERWAENLGDDRVKTYWKEKNQVSLDGKPTHILDS